MWVIFLYYFENLCGKNILKKKIEHKLCDKWYAFIQTLIHSHLTKNVGNTLR